MPATWDDITATVARDCATAGFDLVQPLQVGWYNAAVAPAVRLPDFGRAGALAVLIANTRTLWPHFLATLRAAPALLGDPHPLDRHTQRSVLSALSALPVAWTVCFANEPPPRRVAMQRLAHHAGLAHLSPSWLSVHRVYGPWIGLRAVAVIDVDGPPGPPPAVDDPCSGCAASCVPLLERARATLASAPSARVAVSANWRTWLALRDACPVGRAHRYSDAQIEYHYTWDRALLARALAADSRS